MIGLLLDLESFLLLHKNSRYVVHGVPSNLDFVVLSLKSLKSVVDVESSGLTSFHIVSKS